MIRTDSPATAPANGLQGLPRLMLRLLPGFIACGVVALAATALQAGEKALVGRAWVESLVLAILIGAGVRLFWRPDLRTAPGIAFTAKPILEFAVVLLGASVSAATLWSIGPLLIVLIAVVVAVAIALGYAVGRMVGLKWRMAALIACGNAICGNSAIVAIAPVIGADGEDIATSIAFTALLGIVAVVAMPLIGVFAHMDPLRYGAWAGMTIYAVPQVLAATSPLGSVASQTGTLVKLVRVLMLGPVSVALSILMRRREGAAEGARLDVRKLVPWFIVGFLALAALRSLSLIPQPLLAPAAQATNVLTVLSMAALGLSTDLRAVARAGVRASAAATVCLFMLAAIAFGAVALRGLF
ncbi:MAG TPA: putative sulfate exporter family transporter [Caulobacteraceae bacterium]|nr:putative sulfate exporter family transporter [Caulobacteraceae bacterium]